MADQNNVAATAGQTAGRTIQSIDRAIAIVEALAGEAGGLSLAELARMLSLAPQTLQSLLRTLQHHGWVVQHGRGKPYLLGPAPGGIARQWARNQDRAALAGPLVVELSRSVGEYVILAEWAGRQLVPLVEFHPDRQLSVRGEWFAIDRLHTMATGKVLMAQLSEDRLENLLDALPMPRLGPRAISDKSVLREELDEIKQSGVALCVEESARGVVAVAVPVAGTTDVPAALGISLPLARFSPARQDELVSHLRRTAENIAQAWVV